MRFNSHRCYNEKIIENQVGQFFLIEIGSKLNCSGNNCHWLETLCQVAQCQQQPDSNLIIIHLNLSQKKSYKFTQTGALYDMMHDVLLKIQQQTFLKIHSAPPQCHNSLRLSKKCNQQTHPFQAQDFKYHKKSDLIVLFD